MKKARVRGIVESMQSEIDRLLRELDYANGRIARMEGEKELQVETAVRGRLRTALYEKDQEIQRLTNAVASWQHEVKLRDEQIENFNADRDTYD